MSINIRSPESQEIGQPSKGYLLRHIDQAPGKLIESRPDRDGWVGLDIALRLLSMCDNPLSDRIMDELGDRVETQLPVDIDSM